MSQSHRPHRLKRLVLGASGWILAACAEPAGPAPLPVIDAVPPAAARVADAVDAEAPRPAATALHRRAALAEAVSVSRTIGPAGGTLELAALGVTLTVPAGALERETALTLTALPGDVVAYDLTPHSLVVQRPVLLRQELGTTTWRSGAELDVRTFDAVPQPDERPRRPATRDAAATGFTGESFTIRVRRFTGYLLSMA